jgi:hypothetical protein
MTGSMPEALRGVFDGVEAGCGRAALDRPFVIERPDELRGLVSDVHARLGLRDGVWAGG